MEKQQRGENSKQQNKDIFFLSFNFVNIIRTALWT